LRQFTAVFANYICHFGPSKVLLDLAREVVVPSFTDDSYVRSYGATTYHFHETELLVLDDTTVPPVLGIAGRFVKNTIIKRVQVFDDAQGIVKDPKYMESAPSVLFVLVLNTHRLIYMPETPSAPNLDAFRATSQLFLTKQYQKFVDLVYNIPSNRSKGITKKRIREVFPGPLLNVVPLTGSEGIAAFIDRYSILKKIEFKLIKPNDDIDAGEIFQQMREFSSNLGADRTKFTVANPEEGLDKSVATESVQQATERGNQEITLDGLDEAGQKLLGNNENFQIQVQIPDVPSDKKQAIMLLYKKYKQLSEGGELYEPEMTAEVEAKVHSLKGIIDG
jgi:hypothetical protein